MAKDKKNRRGTPLKQKKVSDLADKLRRAQMTVVTDYRGMRMAEMAELRGQLRKVDTEFHVVKNTLVQIASANTPAAGLSNVLTGTSAIAFCFGDVAASAKLLADAARTSKFLKVKAALVQGQVLPPEQLQAIANLPPKPVLQAQLLGALQGPTANLVGVLNGPMQGFLAVLQARAQQLGAS